MVVAGKELNLNIATIGKSARSYGFYRSGDFLWSYDKLDKIHAYSFQSPKRILSAILQIDKTMNIVEKYNNVEDVDKSLFHIQNIILCCERKELSHHGFYWCYEDDFNDGFIQYIKERTYHYHHKPRYRAVCQCDKNNHIIATYPSIKEAYQQVSDITAYSTFRHYFLGNSNYGFNTTGFYWRYAKDMPQTDGTLDKVV